MNNVLSPNSLKDVQRLTIFLCQEIRINNDKIYHLGEVSYLAKDVLETKSRSEDYP